MSEAREITPILLAAGASSRMGRPKALLDFDGKTCLEIALDAVRGLGGPIVVLGPDREEVRRGVDLGSATVAVNDDVAGGQSASLKAALALLPAPAAAFLFYPVDFPLVSSAEVGRLVDAFLRCSDPGKAIFIPSHDLKRGHPVLCRRALAEEFLALSAGEPARAVINARPPRIAYVTYEQAYILMDMDTPEDYAGCLEAYRARERRKDR
ncbi:MAG TPA: nucleotidyltransferase family protein [Planctomycetota bacterium]|nr:nucleotidyltransferase family protein [Planctomycetota bacterium]